MRRWQLATIFIVASAVAFGVTYTVGHQRHSQGLRAVHVGLKNDTADPSVVSVKIGQYVQFDSRDGQSHSLTQGTTAAAGAVAHHAANGNASSGVFKANEAWQAQFKKAGTYSFYDELNPKIQVTVVAYQSKK